MRRKTMNSYKYAYDDPYTSEDYDDDDVQEAGGYAGGYSSQRPYRRPVKVANGSSYYRPRPWGTAVSQVQQELTMAQVGKDMATNGKAIKELGERIDDVSMRQKREYAALRKDVRKTRQLAFLLPF